VQPQPQAQWTIDASDLILINVKYLEACGKQLTLRLVFLGSFWVGFAFYHCHFDPLFPAEVPFLQTPF
jgi:hypothetical protein